MKQQGFTLIELMIVVVLIGIMAMVAIPAFNDSVEKSRRMDGHNALVGLQLEMEKYRGNCALFPTAIEGADDCANRKIGYSTTSPEGYYSLSVVAANSTGNAYKILADLVGAQAEDSACDPLTITVNNLNPKGLREPENCW